jgi:hypothetical protein
MGRVQFFQPAEFLNTDVVLWSWLQNLGVKTTVIRKNKKKLSDLPYSNQRPKDFICKWVGSNFLIRRIFKH